MNTISKTYELAEADNLGISKHFIRKLVLQGVLPSIRAGNRYLINYEHLLAYLHTPQIIPNESKKSKIRKANQGGEECGNSFIVIDSKFLPDPYI